MSPSPNHSASVESVCRITGHMDQQSKILPTSQANTIRNGSTTQNGLSDITLSGSDLNLMRLADRIRTFENWPVPFMNINELAAAGFYYFNKGDIVKCPYCSIEVGRWEEGDDPLVDHRRHSPFCRFVGVLERRPSVTQNLPQNLPSDTLPNGYDVCGPFALGAKKPMDPENSSKQSALQRLGIYADNEPTYPNYMTLESRLRSFESWPVSLKLKPNELSDAGFFYTGKGDQTMCFHCGGGLKDWVETDDPWVEHARHFSKCNYVLLTKGREFVDESCGKKTELVSMTQEEMKAVIESHSSVVPVPAADIPVIERKSVQESCSQTTESGKDVSSSRNDDSLLCRVCYAEERTAAFLPCGHLAVCSKCGIGLKTCVVCRAPCEARVRIIIS